MTIRFNNKFYNDWEKVGELYWHRTPLYPKASNGEIKIVSMIMGKIKPPQMDVIWYPEFTGDLVFLQEIFDRTNDQVIFKKSQAKMAMDYTDKFLFKIDRLKAFI